MGSGFFLARSVFSDTRPFRLDEIADETTSYLLRKIKAVFVPYCVGFAGCFALLCLNGIKRGIIGKGLVFDLLMLSEVGLSDGSIVAPGWYLSVLFTVVFLLYPFLRWNKRFFSGWVAPVLSVFTLGALCRCLGGICNRYGTPFGLFSAAWIRGLGEICLGVMAFNVSQRLERTRIQSRPFLENGLRIAASSLPFFAFAWIASARADPETELLCFAAFVALSGSGRSCSKFFPARLCRFLGRLSLWLYLTHWSVMRALMLANEKHPVLQSLFAARDTRSIAISLALYLVLCFALAIGCMVVWDAICDRRAKPENCPAN